jgi:hypothetical protein
VDAANARATLHGYSTSTSTSTSNSNGFFTAEFAEDAEELFLCVLCDLCGKKAVVVVVSLQSPFTPHLHVTPISDATHSRPLLWHSTPMTPAR